MTALLDYVDNLGDLVLIPLGLIGLWLVFWADPRDGDADV
jgi:hypothetical protein